ncbi:MarR family transcriptional regulator [Clostridium botulinum]|uniref:Winged helix-turn-helix transcriptional regulator n=1 Tax=Companilactobacillus halodurans TaxID=2584183 RepID=A0A5P0ZYJ0_9LACO|nr:MULTISPECIES: MarR family winged helix-turn-helix transcriptional regulator [Bacillota]MCS6109154.1 MarR family transcriptional regulator [Clostridium botulinum]MQS76635.1 winged helix-turn-helix transcriptional regulator [Companilactobacillus halodurans]MQS97804.1 winged helix-turn-helix transcriptional regulator [Companilactobacillus halodurans]
MTSDVARLIKVASNEISRDINKFASKYGLTGNQVQIIYYLANSKQENSYQKDIEKEFNIRRPTATNILKTMEKNGLILRRYQKNDSRLKQITLSDKAKEMQTAIENFMDENNQKILSTLGTLERHSFVHALKKIPQKLKK